MFIYFISHFYTFDDSAVSIDQWCGNRTLKLPEPMPNSGDVAVAKDSQAAPEEAVSRPVTLHVLLLQKLNGTKI